MDEQGYVIRRSVLEEGTRPEYIIPVGSANGVWGMMKRVGRFRGEGWLALWKGGQKRNMVEREKANIKCRAADILRDGSAVGYSSTYDRWISTKLILPGDKPIPARADDSSSGVAPNNRILAVPAGLG